MPAAGALAVARHHQALELASRAEPRVEQRRELTLARVPLAVPGAALRPLEHGHPVASPREQGREQQRQATPEQRDVGVEAPQRAARGERGGRSLEARLEPQSVEVAEPLGQLGAAGVAHERERPLG